MKALRAAHGHEAMIAVMFFFLVNGIYRGTLLFLVPVVPVDLPGFSASRRANRWGTVIRWVAKACAAA